MAASTKRYETIDMIRGVAIVLMVAYHGIFVVHDVLGMGADIFAGSLWNVLFDCVRVTFIFIAGLCSRLSRSSLKRGALVFAMAMAVTAATGLVLPEFIIIFGILHFMGLSMVVTAGMSPMLKKVPASFGIAVCAVLFAVTKRLSAGCIWPMGNLKIGESNSFLAYVLGLPSQGFYSSDYFPVIPWIFCFWLGFFAFPTLIEHQEKPWLHKSVALLNLAGRNSLVIYMVHQPIIYGVCLLCQKLLG